MNTQNPNSPAAITAAIGFSARNFPISVTFRPSPGRAPGRVVDEHDAASSLRRTRTRHATCSDDRVHLPRLRSLPVWQQDGLIALTTWLVGFLVYAAGIHRLPAGFDHAPLWVRLLELTALSGLELLRRWVPGALLLATAVLAVGIALSPSLPVMIVFTDFLYAATLYGSRRR